MPCQNGGECLIDQTNFNLFVCMCQEGFTGGLCETQISPCASTPCLNEATCREGDGEEFECLCAPGYTGSLCQDEIDECQNAPCQNNGTCVDGLNSFSCQCLPEFSGPTCEVQVIFCSQESCQNGGTCFEVEGGFICDCTLGYTGDNCEINIDECEDNPCENEATCADLVGGFYCLCPPGFTGQLCNDTIDFCVGQSCSGNGECSSLTAGFECVCDSGFTGQECERDIDECAPSPCENNATCLEGINFFMCLCPDGYTGPTCDTDIDECASLPCKNGATCNNLDGSFVCNCPLGFSGLACETQTDFCVNQICHNGGTCVSGESGFICQCPAGWSGSLCQYADNVAVKLQSCGLFAHDVLNDTGYDDPISFVNGIPSIYVDNYELAGQPNALYWSAWIWQQESSAMTLFSYETMDVFEPSFTELVSDVSAQQLRFYYSKLGSFGLTTINATLNISLLTNRWHHISVVMWRNGTVSAAVDEVYTQTGEFGTAEFNAPGAEIPMIVSFSLPSSMVQFNFTLARSIADHQTRSQPFTGIMRGVAIAEIPSTDDLDPLGLDQCLLNCIGGENFCSNGAQCQDLFGPNRRCSCPYGYGGLQCQYLHSRFSFDGTGYVLVTDGPLNAQPFSFGFKTEATAGELYNHRGLSRETSLSLNEETVVFELISCDSTNISVTAKPPPSAILSDNQWHTVTSTGETFQLDNNSPQAADVQLPACNNSNPGQLVLGSFSDVADTSNNFAGCFRELSYDGVPLDATSVELVGGAQFGCDRDTAQFFSASFLELPNFNSREAQTISFEVSTLASEAVLYFSRRVPADATGPNPSDFVAIYLENGQVVFTFNLGEGDVTVRTSLDVSDGNWHHVEAMQNSTLSWLAVDGVRVQRPVTSQLELLDTTGSVFLGGVPLSEQFLGFELYTSFDGCLRDLEQNGVATDLRNSTTLQNIRFGTCN